MAGADVVQVITTQPPFAFVQTPDRVVPPIAVSADLLLKSKDLIADYDPLGGGAFLNTSPPFPSLSWPWRPEQLFFARPQILLPDPMLELRKFTTTPRYDAKRPPETSRFSLRPVQDVFTIPVELQRFVPDIPRWTSSPTYPFNASWTTKAQIPDAAAIIVRPPHRNLRPLVYRRYKYFGIDH